MLKNLGPLSDIITDGEDEFDEPETCARSYMSSRSIRLSYAPSTKYHSSRMNPAKV